MRLLQAEKRRSLSLLATVLYISFSSARFIFAYPIVPCDIGDTGLFQLMNQFLTCKYTSASDR